MKALPCWGFVLLVAALGWPIWQAQTEYALARRRVMLRGMFQDDSRVRRWFWSGRIAAFGHAFVAIAWAALLVAFAVRLTAIGWTIVVVDLVLVWLVAGPMRRRVAGEIRAEHVDVIVRRWPLTLANLVLLAIAFFAVGYFLGAPDTRGLTWLEVFHLGWQEGEAATCPMLGVLVGGIAAIERLAWHAAEVLVPLLDHPALRFAAWVVLLLQAGVFGWALTRLALGLQAVTQGPRHAAWPYWLAVLAVGSVTMFAAAKMDRLEVAAIGERLEGTVRWANPCRGDDAALNALSRDLATQLQAAGDAAIRDGNARLAQRLDAIFSEAEPGVDRYLDWYFSVLGEYQRLGKLVQGELDQMMAAALERHLFGEGMFGERLASVGDASLREAASEISAAATRMGATVVTRVRADPCRLGDVNLAPIAGMPRDVVRVSSSAAGGALGAIAVRTLAKEAVAATAARAASRQAYSTGSKLLGRTVAKRGGTLALSGSAAGLCAPGGLLALVCGAGVFVASWLGLDKAFIAIDEYRFRDAMRAEILASMKETRQSVEASLQERQAQAVRQMQGAVQADVEKIFVPARM